MRRIAPAEAEWLREHYPVGTINENLDDFEAEFGWRPTKRTLYQRAHKMGLRKMRQDPGVRTGRAQTTIRWSREPDMEAWMLEHDRESHQSTIEAFEAEFGIRLSRGQINIFRASHGTQRRKSYGGRPRRPVGYERRTKGGILVKVAEEATVPMSKDNWRYKHHIAYEEAWGPIPDGCVVAAVDGDSCNCDPENLAAIPRRAQGVINQWRGEGLAWQDRDEFLAAAAVAALGVAINDAEAGMERPCAVCGRMFRETEKQRRDRGRNRVATCPDCVSQGRLARGDRGDKAPTVCKVCGRTFPRSMRSQVRCPECIARRPKYGASKQIRQEGGAAADGQQ